MLYATLTEQVIANQWCKAVAHCIWGCPKGVENGKFLYGFKGAHSRGYETCSIHEMSFLQCIVKCIFLLSSHVLAPLFLKAESVYSYTRMGVEHRCVPSIAQNK